MQPRTSSPKAVCLETARQTEARYACSRMAAIFTRCFPHSVQDMFGDRPPNPRAMADFFTFVVRAEPQAVHLAWESREPAPAGPQGGGPQGARDPETGEQGKLVGYAITPRSMPRLWVRAALTFVWIPWVVRFLAGDYGLGLDAVPRVFRSKVAFARSFRPENNTVAQILSMAVDPAWRGRGVGRALLGHGLDYLRRQRVPRVKLEVLDDNASARHLYESMGFRSAGEVPYGPRRWVIMIKDLSPAPESSR